MSYTMSDPESGEIVNVSFYIEPNGEVFAYFPDIPYANTGAGRMAYSHVGQHSI